jgi:hypothetical protein
MADNEKINQSKNGAEPIGKIAVNQRQNNTEKSHNGKSYTGRN